VEIDAGRGADYYRADYGDYEPDWIMQPDGVSPAAWDRYLTSQPGSDGHKAAYAEMHREVKGEGFPGPDPDRSYMEDHGYARNPEPGPEERESGYEPEDADHAAAAAVRARQGELARERAAGVQAAHGLEAGS
jgi:hypothetical protein